MLNYPATPTVVTFDPHPQEFFTGQCRTLLTPLAEKVQQLAQLGVEQLVLLPFNHELACLSPRAFVQEILVQKLAARSISVGFTFALAIGGLEPLKIYRRSLLTMEWV